MKIVELCVIFKILKICHIPPLPPPPIFAAPGQKNPPYLTKSGGNPPRLATLVHPETLRSVGVIFSKFLQSALFSKIHSYVARVFKKRISSLEMDYFSILVYQYAYMEYIRDPRN